MKFYITIDTEPDCDVKWKRSSPLTFTSITHGIPNFLRPIWNKNKIFPIYFVSPEVVMDNDSCEILKKEIEQGAIIGSHLHSEYIEPNKTFDIPEGKSSGEFPCYAHSTEIEYQKIKNLTQLIEDRLNYKPVWYRAARFGADIDTIRSLSKLGYKYDSSITPEINWTKINGPDHSHAPIQPYWIDPNNFYNPVKQKDSIGIQEIPITIHAKRFGVFGKLFPNNWLFYNWLRPTHMTVFEQKKLINNILQDYEKPTLTLMFHSMEVIINKTPYVRNKFMQKRFINNLEKIIQYLHRKSNVY